jgi:Cu2+-exporting ATPase
MLFTLPRYLGMESDFPLANLFSLLTLLFATLSFVVGGSYFIVRAVRALRVRVLHIDLPIALGVTLAYLGSIAGWLLEEERFLYFDFVSIFTFLMLVGRWLQERAVVRNRNQLTAQQAEPEAVTRLTPRGSERIPLDSVAIGDELEIGPGEMVPVSGELSGRGATFSLEWINGESEPRPFPDGRLVPAGATSIESVPVHLVATEVWADSLLARLLAPTQREDAPQGYQIVLKYYLAVILVLAVTGGLVWGWVLGQPLTGWQVALSILVVSCPCALGIAHPLADELAIARLRGHGLFLKNLGLFSRLGKIREILFDKTGTLTFEHPALQNPEAVDTLSAEDRAVLRQIVEASHHPLSRSLREVLLARPTVLPARSASANLHLTDVPGAGLRAESDAGTVWTLGRADWDGAGNTSEARATDVVFRRDGTDLAHFHFADQLRDHARETLTRLRARYGIFILSGDRREKVDTLARELGLPPRPPSPPSPPRTRPGGSKAGPPAPPSFSAMGRTTVLPSTALPSAAPRSSIAACSSTRPTFTFFPADSGSFRSCSTRHNCATAPCTASLPSPFSTIPPPSPSALRPSCHPSSPPFSCPSAPSPPSASCRRFFGGSESEGLLHRLQNRGPRTPAPHGDHSPPIY